MDRQAHADDRVQGGRRHQVAAVENGLRPERLGLLDRGGKRLAMVVAVGDDADFQVGFPGGVDRTG
jgi:hypothetical protein